MKPYEVQPGRVYFIGAGPGAADLITLRGRSIIEQADFVLYADSLVQDSVAALNHKSGVRVQGTKEMNLDEFMPLMIEAARVGDVVARVHSGDPSIYGAIHEQMTHLDAAGVPYEIVPGVPSFFAAAARLGIELTVPEVVQTAIFTRIAGRTPMPIGEDLKSLAAHGASLGIHLAVTRIRQVVDELLASGGYTPQTPVAVIHKVTWDDESMVTGTLADIADKVRAAGYTKQALIVVSPALDPTLKNPNHQSNLYDKAYTHRFRKAAVSSERQPSTPNGNKPQRQGTVIIAVTRAGAGLAAKLAAQLGAVAVVPQKFASDDTQSFADSALAEVRRRWVEHQHLILIMPTGVAVRALAPLLGHKHSDPAVICLDEGGKSVIPLLGGHQAGANALAKQVAALTGGHAAITTASDLQGLPALDLLGDWYIHPQSALTHASAALVNGDSLGIYLDPALESFIMPQLQSWFAGAENILWLENLADLDSCPAGIVVSHQQVAARHFLAKTVVYHPPVLVAGMGCKRGVAAEELRAALENTLQEAGLALESLAVLVTVDLKADESGLQELAAQLGIPLQVIPAAQLQNLDAADYSPSAATDKFDLPGVAEPCAILGADGGRLLLPKRSFDRCTVALALREG